jgi:hypothetical protein
MNCYSNATSVLRPLSIFNAPSALRHALKCHCLAVAFNALAIVEWKPTHQRKKIPVAEYECVVLAFCTRNVPSQKMQYEEQLLALYDAPAIS